MVGRILRMKRNKFYITTPIYYVNSKPHVGTLYSTLLADVAARWQRLLGKQVWFMVGSDEHGQKIQEKAESVGKQPQQFVDEMIPAFTNAWEKYEIDYSTFARTTDPWHIYTVTTWIKKLQEQGDIYKAEYTGMYCVPDETFVTVGAEAPKDDQGNYLCPTCNRPLRELSEESYFFRLSAYEEQLLKFYEEHPDFITPKERMNEVVAFVKAGLKDLSISRKTVSWGIPFPGDPSHTVYVWGDALNIYLSNIGYGRVDAQSQEKFDQWWPADVQVMAKDIVRFHAVYWPAFLMAASLPLPKKLLVHGWILMGENKMSKSLGNAIDPDTLAEWYGVEQVRYYLMRQMAITQDGQFDLKDLENHITADLANNLGNLLNRTLTLALNNNLKEVKAPPVLEAVTVVLKEKCAEAFRVYQDEMHNYNYHIALAELWRFISEVNAYFHALEPWKLAKNNKELFAETIYAACQSLKAIGIMLWPVMPKKMEQLLASLGHTFDIKNNYEKMLRETVWNGTCMLTKTDEPLFIRPESRIETNNTSPEKNETLAPVQGSAPITITDFAKVQLVVGTIESCERVSGSDKLLKLQVDMGVTLGKRQILSGVAQHFLPEELVGKQGIYVANLPPRKMMGLESQGMMIFAKNDEGKWQIATVSGNVPNGSEVG